MIAKKPVVLQIFPFPFPEAAQRLAQQFELIELWNEDDPDAVLASCADRVQLMVTSALKHTPAALIDRLPALKAICSLGVGYDAIDVKHAQSKDISVSNTPDVLNDCVADLAWALILSTARRTGHAERYARQGLWESDGAFPLARKVSHQKLGILGLGRIGMAIAQRAEGFNMQVRYHNRNPRPDAPYPYQATLGELAAWADFLVVATVGGEATRHLVDRDVLKALGPDGIIINIARGSVIDEAALITALQQGDIAAAGLDVYEDEPRIPEALKSLDNVVILPHIASATRETRRGMADLVVQNVESYFAKGELLTPIPRL